MSRCSLGGIKGGLWSLTHGKSVYFLQVRHPFFCSGVENGFGLCSVWIVEVKRKNFEPPALSPLFPQLVRESIKYIAHSPAWAGILWPESSYGSIRNTHQHPKMRGKSSKSSNSPIPPLLTDVHSRAANENKFRSV